VSLAYSFQQATF